MNKLPLKVLNKTTVFRQLFFFMNVIVITVIWTMVMINFKSIPQNTVNTSIFYINDFHGQVPKMERTVTAAHKFDEFIKEQKGNVDGFKVSSGDILIGENPQLGYAATEFENAAGIDVQVLGNHEFDSEPANLPKFLDLSKAASVGTNVKYKPGTPLASRIQRAVIIERNGHKYGFIGALLPNLGTKVKDPRHLNGISIDSETQTLIELQEEADRLRSQGVNKIILLSHAGYDMDKRIAQSVTGIDVILGGHTHNLLKGVVNKQNFFLSPVKEPVLITQAGCNGENYGVLDLTFNEKGQIIGANNKVIETSAYKKDPAATTAMDKYLGKPVVIGRIGAAENFSGNPLHEENPYANFILDAVKSEMDADIALMNSGNMRGTIDTDIFSRDITDRDISSISPYKNSMCLVYLNQKELVDAIKCGLRAMQTPGNTAGLLQVSGLRYVGTSEGELKELDFIDKQGKKHPIDINNPDVNTKYRVAYDDFLARGRDGFTMLNKLNDADTKRFDYDKDYCTINYVKKFNGKPVNIKSDGRITIMRN